MLLPVAGLAFGFAWREARSDPIVRRAAIALADWPAGAAPMRIALISDLHLCGATMGPARLTRINRIVQDLHADLIVIAGDFVSRLEPGAADCAGHDLPRLLGAIKPPLGMVAVLGNHDNWSESEVVREALHRARVEVVENSAIRRGPLLLGGSGDTVSGHAKLGGTLNALARLRRAGPGATVYVSHSPDIFKWLPPGPALLLAGHTHCGQIVLPVIGALFEVSELNGNALRCGLIRRARKTVIITAGLGTSHTPLRLGAPPDLWMVTLGPSADPISRPG